MSVMVKMRSIARQLPAGVWVVGSVSLLMDLSSEMIHSLLPLFMVTSLGASVVAVGVIEGFAEATALIVKVFSGVLSDYWARRKGLTVFGYGLAVATKPLFAMATSIGTVFFARFADRIGKGIRGAPRDALVADITPLNLRGAAYGLRQSMDTIGAVLGPLTAVLLMTLFTATKGADAFRAVFWVAVIPGILAVALLVFVLREPPSQRQRGKAVNPIQRDSLARLSVAYWWVVAIGALFALARFSEAFLVLQADHIGIAVTYVPLVMVVMNIAYAASAYPFGALSDHTPHAVLLALGLVVLIISDIVLALSQHWLTLSLGVVLWGVHMGMTQGLLSTMVSHTAPEDLRGTAFGVFNLVSGLAMLVASTVAGVLWEQWGAATTFLGGAGFAVLALGVLLGKGRK